MFLSVQICLINVSHLGLMVFWKAVLPFFPYAYNMNTQKELN